MIGIVDVCAFPASKEHRAVFCTFYQFDSKHTMVHGNNILSQETKEEKKRTKINTKSACITG